MNFAAECASPASRGVLAPDVSPKRIARIRFSLLTALVLLTIVCVALGWWYRRHTYVAQAYLRIAYGDMDGGSDRRAEVFRETQRALMKSTFVINAVLARNEILNLDCVSRLDDPEEWLHDKLEITFPGNGEIMEISLAGREVDMPDCCKLVDSVIESYDAEVLHRERAQRKEAQDAQRDAAQRAGEELKEKIDRLNNLVQELGTRQGSEPAELALMRAEIEALIDVWKDLQSRLLKERFEEQRRRSPLTVLQQATPVRR